MTEEAIVVTGIIVFGTIILVSLVLYGGEPDLMDAIRTAVKCK